MASLHDNARLPSSEPPLYGRLDARTDAEGYHADWLDSRHHYRRFSSEFIGTFGFVFSLSGGAAIFHAYGTPNMSPGVTVALLTMVAALWLVIAIYALGTCQPISTRQ